MGREIGIFFYSDKIYQVLTEIDDIQFDGVFYTVPIQNIFARIGRHVIPCIHCLLTSKQETLYTALLYKIHELLPQLSRSHGMSDRERAARNAVMTVFPGIHLHGCQFDVAQNIWRKLQKLGLTKY